MSKPLIFVSYAHEDSDFKNDLLQELRALEQQGLCEVWHDRELYTGDELDRKIQEATGRASMAVLLLSKAFMASSYIQQTELPLLEERRKQAGVRLMPFLLQTCQWQRHSLIPKILVGPENATPLNTLGEVEQEAAWTALGQEVAELLAQLEAEGGVAASVSSFRLSLHRLPNTGPHFLGREAQLTKLDGHWADPTTNVVTIVAPGGVGKTSLLNAWLDRMGKDGYQGAARVYGWSFYSQGTGEDRNATAETFLDEALEWFGEPARDKESTHRKGERLAELVQQEKTLLVLDGLEPHQQPPVAGVSTGRLKDPGLAALLKNLAAANHGLCVVTTRERVEDLEGKEASTAPRMELEQLSVETGVKLLKLHQVKGPREELAEAVAGLGCHALAVTLLGTFLRVAKGGDIRHWREVELFESSHAEHAWKVMDSYVEWFEMKGGEVELAILRVMGLFDRPAEPAAIEAVLAEPAIEGFTEPLAGLSEIEWAEALDRLRTEARLLLDGEGGALDAHPLVRQYFAEQLRKSNEPAFREGHRRLFEYFRSLPEKQFPDTLEELEPLYRAVGHGCRAGLYEVARAEVYRDRIYRGREAYSWKKLGAHGSNLAALAGFFTPPWKQVVGDLTPAAQSWVLSEATFALRAQGRLGEAVEPMRASLELHKEQKLWKNAAIQAGNLSELLLTLGRVEGSLAAGRESVALADESGDAEERLIDRTTLADALAQGAPSGLGEAVELFEEAERMQAEERPQVPRLTSLPGFRYCELRLAGVERVGFGAGGWERADDADGQGGELRATAEDAIRRAEAAQETAKRNGWTLDIAVNHLTLGRAHLGLALTTEDDPASERDQARHHLDQAVAGLRKSGNLDDLPRGLLTRANFHRLDGDRIAAHKDLQETFDLATRSDMLLFLTDAHLLAARMALQGWELKLDGQPTTARAHWEAARGLVERTGYRRRDWELAWLGERLG